MEPNSYADHSSPSSASASHYFGLSVIFKSITLMVVICAGAIENAAIIYVIVKDRRLHRAPYYFVINQVMADLLRSVICLPFVQASVIHGSVWQYGSSACKLLAFASTFFIFGSVFALLVLAIDRYLSTLHRKFHARRLSGGICLSVVLFGWAAAFVLAFPPIFGLGSYDSPQQKCALGYSSPRNSDVTLIFVAVFVVVASVTLFLYGRMFLYIRKHRRMKPVHLEPACSPAWNMFQPALGSDPGDEGQRSATRVADALPRPVARGQLLQGRLVQQPIPDHYIPLQVIHSEAAGIPSNRLQPDNSNATYRIGCEREPPVDDQLTRALFIVTSFYGVLWLPYVISMCWFMFQVDSAVARDSVSVTAWLTYCQAAVLPLVYILSHKPVGKQVLGTSALERHPDGDPPNYLLSVNA